MTQRTLWFIAMTILVAAVTTNMFGGARERDGIADPVSASAGANCALVSHNRRVDSIGFSTVAGGGLQIELGYSMQVSDTGGAVDMRADILVEILVGGVVVSQTTIPAEFDFVSAITCATNCAGSCPSIFGDGACVKCDCDYKRSATLPGTLATGDMVRATILPLAVAAPEIRTTDDVLEVTFGAPQSPCCPWDTDGDGMVGIVDFLAVLANWGPCP
jgi:hypothetical protein